LSSPCLRKYSFLSSIGRKKKDKEAEASLVETAVAATTTEEDVSNQEPVPPPPPLIIGRHLDFFQPVVRLPRQAWVENLDTIEEKKVGDD